MKFRTTISLKPHRHADLIEVLNRIDASDRTSYLCDLAAEMVRVWRERSAGAPSQAGFPLGTFLPPALPALRAMATATAVAPLAQPADELTATSVSRIPILSPEKVKAAFGPAKRNAGA
jgi:hypothetical protein